MAANTRSKRMKEDRRIDSDDFDTIVKTHVTISRNFCCIKSI